MKAPTAVAAIVILLQTACASGDSPGALGTSISDSAGVTIVTNRDHGWQGRDPWTLSERPILTIGEFEGAEEYQLFRVTGALRLPDGSIVVANGGTRQLRFFAPDGVFLRSVGREGGGPGEFSMIASLQRYRGDSLLVYDGQSLVFSMFSAEGEFGRSGRLETPDGSVSFLAGATDDGSLLAQATDPFAGGLDQGVNRTPQTFTAYDPRGTNGRDIGQFPGFEFYRGSGRMAFGAVPFGRSSQVAGHGDRAVAGANDAYELQFYELDGSLSRIVRLDIPLAPVTSEDVERDKDLRRERLENMTEPFRGVQEGLIDEVPYPDFFPAFRGFHIDREENLWVEVFNRPGVLPRTFRVFSPEGELLGPVTLPESFAPLDIGSDYVLGRYVDDLDVEFVMMYRLQK